MMPAFGFRVHRQLLAVSKLASDSPLPGWALAGGFSSVTRTPAELSIVCAEDRVPAEVQAERGWACLELQGPIPFSMTGVLQAFLTPLAAAGISIFALSTYDTDWVLVPSAQLGQAIDALTAAGHEVMHG
jgi:hypothetical protein